MRQIEDHAEKETNDNLEKLKSNIKELEEQVFKLSNYDYSKIEDERVREHIIKDFVIPKKKELEKLKKGLENFNFEEWKKRSMEWQLYSAGGLGYSFRYKRYKEEALNKNLTKEDIIDLFVTALEGGSNYWYYMDLPENINSYGQSTSEAVGEYILQGGYIIFYDVEEYERVIQDKERGEYNIQGDVEDEKSFNEDLEETKLGYVDLDKVLDTNTKSVVSRLSYMACFLKTRVNHMDIQVDRVATGDENTDYILNLTGEVVKVFSIKNNEYMIGYA